MLCRAVNETFRWKWHNILWWFYLGWLPKVYLPALCLYLLKRKGGEIKMEKIIGWDKDKKTIYCWLPTWANQCVLGEKLIWFSANWKHILVVRNNLKTAFLQSLSLPFPSSTLFLHFWLHQLYLEGDGKWDQSITVLCCFFSCSSLGCNPLGQAKTSMDSPWASVPARNIHHRIFPAQDPLQAAV